MSRAKHVRQADNAVYDGLRSRWFGGTKAQQQKFVDEVAADPQVQRGVTVTVPVDFDNGPGRIVGRRSARLMFSDESEEG